MAAKVPGFANAVGYWGRNPACRIVTDQTAAKIRALLQDQLLANGRPVWLWQPVSSATPDVVACTCDKNTTQSADFKCLSCLGSKFAPGYLKFLHTTLHWSSAAAGGYTLVNAALDYTKKPNRVQLIPGQATGTITTTDRAFSNPTSEDWEIELMAYRRVAGDVIGLSYSLDAGATWIPVALTESPRIGFLGTLTGALKPVGAGNIRFRVTLTRANGATAESPSFEILRARYLRRRDVNPVLFGSTGYQAGQILLLKTWETEVVSRQVAQGRLIEHEGDRSWTAPFDFFDLSLARDTPPVALDDRNPGAHPFFEATSGVRQGRYAMMAVSLDTTIQNIMTHQSLTERLVQPGEMYGLVW